MKKLASRLCISDTANLSVDEDGKLCPINPTTYKDWMISKKKYFI